MKTNNQVIKELKAERTEVASRLGKLNAFGTTSQFEALSVVQRSLIQKQSAAMNTYVWALNERIRDLEADK